MAGDSYALTGFAVPEEIERLHDLLARVAAEHPEIDPGSFMLFETAVIEIANNVVEHGRPRGGVRWQFALDVREDCLDATLSDSGEEFSGRLDGPMPDEAVGSGRGLPLARAALDHLTYRRESGVNHWRMIRSREASR